jgi:hypothetical protein
MDAAVLVFLGIIAVFAYQMLRGNDMRTPAAPLTAPGDAQDRQTQKMEGMGSMMQKHCGKKCSEHRNNMM